MTSTCAHALLASLSKGDYDARLQQFYGPASPVDRQQVRYQQAVTAFIDTFDADACACVCSGTCSCQQADAPHRPAVDTSHGPVADACTCAPDRGCPGAVSIYSASGRSEIGGNHTDHQHGRVLAAAVNLDAIAVVRRRPDSTIRLLSWGYPLITTSVDALDVNPDLFGATISLIHGMAQAFAQAGHRIGGFDAYVTSDVLSGSGLSSSAAFEVLLGTIFNHEYAGGQVDPISIAQWGQYAENVYFGKPCGLMDQMASAVGGLTFIDFADPQAPVVTPLAADFDSHGYSLCITDTKGSHADLTDEYAAIPQEMKAVAAFFGKDHLREVDPQAFYTHIAALRAGGGSGTEAETRAGAGGGLTSAAGASDTEAGAGDGGAGATGGGAVDARAGLSDRAVLRAIHFFAEDARVAAQVKALEAGDFPAFLDLMDASGRSSFEYLQNVYAACNPREQGVAVGLAVSDHVLGAGPGRRGISRVHGGGFAGTIQALVRQEAVEDYRQALDAVFGEGSCLVLAVRAAGGSKVI